MNNIKNKRDATSRFSTDELNKVINNWELVATEHNGSLKIKKTIVDLRPLVIQAVNKENINHIETLIYHLDIIIPFKGNQIRISSSETRPPVIEYLLKSNTYSFSIKNEDFLDKFSKLFGLKELEVEDSDFDKKYLLETNDEIFLRKFLDFKIREWLKENKIAYFDLNTETAKNKLGIYYFFDELDVETIKHQIEMFKYCIDRIIT